MHERHVGEAREVVDDVGRGRRPRAPGRGTSGSAGRRRGGRRRGRPARRIDRESTSYRLSTMPTSAGDRPPAAPAPRGRGRAAGGGRRATASAGSVRPGACSPGGVAEERRAPRLVERRPVATRSPSRCVHDGGVLGERGTPCRGRPAALVLERLRQVPVVERRVGLRCRARAGRRRAGRRSRGPSALTRPRPVGMHPRPRDREAVRRAAPSSASRSTSLASGGSGRRRRAVGAVQIAPGCALKRVPDRRPAAVLGARPRSGTPRSRRPRRSRRGSASRGRGG